MAGVLASGSLAREPASPSERPVPVARFGGQAEAVHRAIHAGGPFAYAKDGTVFGNRERSLPVRSRGYYREYTVSDPGSRHRGARRIICGGRVATAPDGCWYTADHYASFTLITP